MQQQYAQSENPIVTWGNWFLQLWTRTEVQNPRQKFQVKSVNKPMVTEAEDENPLQQFQAKPINDRYVPVIEMNNLLKLLEVESAQLLNLPDSEFSDAYLSFRSRIGRLIDQYLSVGIIGYVMSNSGLLRIIKWFFDEGIELRQRDPDTFTLDPAPFNDMIDKIISSSKPQHQKFFSNEQDFANYKKLKTFADNLINVIATYGPSAAVVQKNFFNAVSGIIDGIGTSSEKVQTYEENKSHSVEVHKTGHVVIACYRSQFDGTITTNCCFDNQTIRMSVEVKVWKFQTLADLKQEYKRLCHRSWM